MPEAPVPPAILEVAPKGHPDSPMRIAYRAFRRHRIGMFGFWLLLGLYLLVIFADFIAPYGPDNQVRDLQWSPPTQFHFSDAAGTSIRPFLYPSHNEIDENFNIKKVQDRTQRCYVRFFVEGDAHRLFGILPTRLHLFGVDRPVNRGTENFARIYLMGADISGRDTFSRICYGSRISMTIGLIGSSLVLVIGLLIGGISGYVGGKTDDILQRLCEAVMLLPGFYLLLMLRFVFPSDMDSVTVYFAVVAIMALVGWPGLARVIRGMVLSIRGRDYIQAARAVGISPLPIIIRHVLPNTMGYVIVSVTLSIPGYILGESALSLLGLGIMEPTPSWGNMLQNAMDIVELDQHPWVLWPGLFIFLAVMGFNMVGDGLRDALDPKQVHGAKQ